MCPPEIGVGTVRPPSGSSSLWGWVPQVTLHATQRLSIVGRLHRPAYQYGTVYLYLRNRTNRTGTYAEGRRSCPTNANRCVAQNATPAEIRKKEGTTLKRSNVCREREWKRFDRLRGRRPYGEGSRR